MDIALRTIERLITAEHPEWKSVNKFKLGLTGEPNQRWFSGGKAPYYKNWDRMYLLHACETLEAAKYIECYLIEQFWDRDTIIGNLFTNREYNDRGGTGRAVNNHGLFYIYVVVLDCGKPPELQRVVRNRPFVLTDACI